MKLSEATIRQCNLSIVGGNITGNYRFKTGLKGLGDMANEFQRAVDFLLGYLPGLHVYLENIIIAVRGSEERHCWNEVRRALEVLVANNAAVKWSECTFFVKEKVWLGFQLSKKGKNSNKSEKSNSS